jgi:pyruvate formate lyase activating enzyme
MIMAKQEQNKAEGNEGATQGYIFNIQRYSIHDGPGIRTTVFLKGCPMRCFWCQNPESQSMQPEILFNEDACNRCGSCVSACPAGAIESDALCAVTDRRKCTGCGICAEVCPTEARKLEGKRISAQEVIDVVLKDRSLYAKSNGGLTVSGGDPTMQPKFAHAILRLAKEHGLHTAIETCGHTDWKILEELLRYTDYLFYDIKTMNPEKHRHGTKYSNALILKNAVKAAQTIQEMHVRCPLIPSFNDSPEDVNAIAEFVVKELKLPYNRFTLLRYNKYAESKYKRLDRESEVLHLEPQSPEMLDKLYAVIGSHKN